jgi:hypothetical protein
MAKTKDSRPLVLKGLPHTKRQTCRTCLGDLCLDVYENEYSCLACGWRKDAQQVLDSLRAHRVLGWDINLS